MQTRSNFFIISDRRFAFIIFGVIVGVCLSELIFPFAKLYWAQYQLQRAIEKWDTNHPAVYQVRIYTDHFYEDKYGCHANTDEHLVTIRNGIVDASKAPSECKALFEQSSIENTFSQIKILLDSMNPYLTQYGFVTYFYYSSADTLFSSKFTDRHLNYEDFQVIK
jgi:hypothetical protein